MSRVQYDAEALSDQKQYYDTRFKQGYMQDFSGCIEASRLFTIREILNRIIADEFIPSTVLDYGCGEGRYIPVLREAFPKATLYGCDISEVGLRIACATRPEARYLATADEAVPLPDSSIDLITCIEVLEHVRNVEKSATEIGRLLRTGGIALISTPCANKFSLEWFYNALSGGLQPSHDGYGRFATDEPGHLRRLTDLQLKSLFEPAGVQIRKIYHRAHLFTMVMEAFRPMRILPDALRIKLALIDWHLFKDFPNGATMVAIGQKSEATLI